MYIFCDNFFKKLLTKLIIHLSFKCSFQVSSEDHSVLAQQPLLSPISDYQCPCRNLAQEAFDVKFMCERSTLLASETSLPGFRFSFPIVGASLTVCSK